MLEARVKELEIEFERDREHDKRIMSRLINFLRKGVAKKDVVEKKAAYHSSN
jgi:hypothetical protein